MVDITLFGETLFGFDADPIHHAEMASWEISDKMARDPNLGRHPRAAVVQYGELEKYSDPYINCMYGAIKFVYESLEGGPQG
ncbi:MAG TPA: hypothetical protein VLF89_01280 [Candidatus Saccharimonadales bacterium]|nr:hypothetical protein [Candidatus Saccharimonadales bacterium]